MTVKFTRKIEDFVCEHCGAKIKGDGFTNHCPVCLWSKHVDLSPGDREASCQGMMEPVRIEKGNREREYILVHRCVKCGYEKRNKTNDNDDFDELLKVTNPTQI